MHHDLRHTCCSPHPAANRSTHSIIHATIALPCRRPYPPEWGTSLTNLQILWATDLNPSLTYTRRRRLLSHSQPHSASHPDLQSHSRELLQSGPTAGPGPTSTYLPPEWAGMTALQSLRLYSSDLYGELPPEWSALEQLTELFIRNGADLQGEIPSAWFDGTPGMTSLMVGGRCAAKGVEVGAWDVG